MRLEVTLLLTIETGDLRKIANTTARIGKLGGFLR
jgi:hypothetical protein